MAHIRYNLDTVHITLQNINIAIPVELYNYCTTVNKTVLACTLAAQNIRRSDDNRVGISGCVSGQHRCDNWTDH